ncbi:MAG: hypothetical protein ACPG5B_07250 [Chitinophagales bacterium]
METKHNFLSEIWDDLMQKHNVSTVLAQKNFEYIMRKYAESTRYYHNQEHLINLFQTILPYKNRLEQPDSVSLAIFYHDVVYKALLKNNERKSAEIALQQMSEMSFSTTMQQEVYALIVATEKHEPTQKTNNFHYFLDADLAILGQTEKVYNVYCEAIRKEYRLVPNVIYRGGRRKVLQHFLEKPRLYFTKEMFDNFEEQARLNMAKELEILTFS